MQPSFKTVTAGRLCQTPERDDSLWLQRSVLQTLHGVKTTLLIAAVICCVSTATVHASETIHKGDVVVVPVHGEVAPSLLDNADSEVGE